LAITPLLPFVCFTCGDDPGDLAAFGEGDVKDPALDLGAHVVAGFAVVFARVPDHFPCLVRESRHHFGEVDTAFSDVLGAFGRIPVELHVLF
jgi:hypothetical protein